MNEQGHFVLEAVIGLAIASLLLMSAYELAGNALAVHRRTDGAHTEAMILGQLPSCFSRIREDMPAPGPLLPRPECAAFEIIESRMLSSVLGSSRMRWKVAEREKVIDITFLVLQR